MNASVITVADVVVGDSYRFADFFFVLNGFSSSPVRVGYSTGRKSGGSPSDPESICPGGEAITFLPGQTSQTVRIPLNHSAPAEGDEPFCLNLFVPAGYEFLLGKPHAAVTLADGAVDTDAKWARFILTLNPRNTNDNGVARAAESNPAPAGADAAVLPNPASQSAEAVAAISDGRIDSLAESRGRLYERGTADPLAAVLPGHDALIDGDRDYSLGGSGPAHEKIVDPRNEVFVFDSAVPELEKLLSAVGADQKIVILDAGSDGVPATGQRAGG